MNQIAGVGTESRARYRYVEWLVMRKIRKGSYDVYRVQLSAKCGLLENFDLVLRIKLNFL